MPILRNAKKALRQANKREAENKVVKKAYKETLKAARKAVGEKEKDAMAKVQLAQKKLDKAVKKGVLKANTASRYMSRLMSKMTDKKAVAKNKIPATINPDDTSGFLFVKKNYMGEVPVPEEIYQDRDKKDIKLRWFPKLETVAGDELSTNYNPTDIAEIERRYNEIMERLTLRQMANAAESFGTLEKEPNGGSTKTKKIKRINVHAPQKDDPDFGAKQEALQQLAQVTSRNIKDLAQEAYEQSIKEHHLRETAHTDPLTSLPNRKGFLLRCEEVRKEETKTEETSFMIFIDIDNFKQVNDNLGHDMGDELLKQIATVLNNNLRGAQDMACRYGGDEFTVFLRLHKGEDTRQQIEDIVKRLYAELATMPAITLGDKTDNWKRSLSVGVTEMPVQDAIQDIVDRADHAAHTAKTQKTENSGGITFLEGDKASYVKATNEIDGDVSFDEEVNIGLETQETLEDRVDNYVSRALAGYLPNGQRASGDLRRAIAKLILAEMEKDKTPTE